MNTYLPYQPISSLEQSSEASYAAEQLLATGAVNKGWGG